MEQGSDSAADAAGRRAELTRLADASGLPVERLLAEVAEMRVALDTDLLLAAAAVDQAQPGIAADAVDSARDHLRAGSAALLDGLATGPEPPRPGRPRRARLAHATALPVLLLTALGGAVAGVAAPRLAGHSAARSGSLADAATQGLLSLSSAAGTNDMPALTSAGDALHSDLRRLITAAGDGDSAAATQAARLLTAEQGVLAHLPGPQAAQLRAAADGLEAQLQVVAGATLATLASAAPEPPSALRSTLATIRSALPGAVPVPGPPPRTAPSGIHLPTPRTSLVLPAEPFASMPPSAASVPRPTPPRADASVTPTPTPAPTPTPSPARTAGPTGAPGGDPGATGVPALPGAGLFP